MKNILFYLTRFPGYGGIETVTELIGTKLQQLGCKISIVTHLSQNRESTLLKTALLYFVPKPEEWDSRKNISFLDDLCKKEKFDAIIYQDSYVPTHKVICSVAERNNIPLFVFEHNTPLFLKKSRMAVAKRNLFKQLIYDKILYPLEDLKFKRRRLLLLDKCQSYVLLSETFKKDFDSVIGRNNYRGKDRIISIHNPIHILKNDLIKSNIILFVGRLVSVKNVDKMLVVWNSIENKYPNWQFVIVGDGPERLNLEKLVLNEGIPRVKFVGYCNPISYYKKAKLFWMMSTYEGFGMTLIEAMQLGCVPIVYNSFSSLDDIVDDGINGFKIPNNQEEYFKEKVCYLIDNQITWSDFSYNAIKKSYEFDIEKIILDWRKLLKI